MGGWEDSLFERIVVNIAIVLCSYALFLFISAMISIFTGVDLAKHLYIFTNG